MNRRFGRWIAATLRCGLWLAMAVAAQAFPFDQEVKTEDNSGIKIRVSTVFLGQPDCGFIPVRVAVENRTNRSLRYQLKFLGSDYNTSSSYNTAIEVNASEQRTFDLLIPWPFLPTSEGRYGSTMLTISGPAVEIGQLSLDVRQSLGSFAAIAEPLGPLAWSKLEAQMKGTGGSASIHGKGGQELVSQRFSSGGSRTGPRNISGSVFRLDELPEDPRALIGVGGIWLRDEDWRGLPQGRRAMLRQWVQEGGKLITGSTAAGESRLAGLPLLKNDKPELFGLGSVRRVQLENKGTGPAELKIDETVRQILDLDASPLPPWSQDFSANWALRSEIGEPVLNVPLIVAFVCIFGLLIGPVNFLVLAPANRRHRLFLTIPVISLVACLLLLLFIRIGDGIGATGVRQAILFAPAGESRHTLFQEQMVRSRLLFGRSFTIPENVMAAFIQQPEEMRYNGKSRALVREGSQMTGDWFRSRSVQGMFLRTTIPSRGEVVIRQGNAGAALQLLSTMASTLRNVWFVDAQGEYWKVAELGTGRPATLEKGTQSDCEAWSTKLSHTLSAGMRQQWRETLGRRGYFFAEADAVDENTIATLPSITWQRQTILCLGSCTEEGTP